MATSWDCFDSCFRSEEIPGYVVTQRTKPSPPPPKPSGPATPAPTPWLQLGKEPFSAGLFRDLSQSSLTARPPSIPSVAKLQDGTIKMRVTRPMDKSSLMNTTGAMAAWHASKSQVSDTAGLTTAELNTPRILELDVNRMMIGQMDVRFVVEYTHRLPKLIMRGHFIEEYTRKKRKLQCLSKYTWPTLTLTSIYINSKPIVPLDDGSQLTGTVVRSYVTVERPTGGKQIRKANQQTTGKTLAQGKVLTYPYLCLEYQRPFAGSMTQWEDDNKISQRDSVLRKLFDAVYGLPSSQRSGHESKLLEVVRKTGVCESKSFL